MASNGKGTCWPKQVLFMGIKNVLTTKFTMYSKPGPNGQNMDKNTHFWHWNYMSVVSQTPPLPHPDIDQWKQHYVH